MIWKHNIIIDHLVIIIINNVILSTEIKTAVKWHMINIPMQTRKVPNCRDTNCCRGQILRVVENQLTNTIRDYPHHPLTACLHPLTNTIRDYPHHPLTACLHPLTNTIRDYPHHPFNAFQAPPATYPGPPKTSTVE